MRNPAQNKILEHFLEHLTKLPKDASFNIFSTIDNDSKKGVYIKIPNLSTGTATYFIGQDKTYGETIVEKLS